MQQQAYNDPDGMSMQNMEGTIKEFLSPGEDFSEQLARAGFSLEDGLDYAEIWRIGVTFRIPLMIAHAHHACAASIGADRQSREEAIFAVTGIRQRMARQAQKQGRTRFRFGRKQQEQAEMDSTT